MGKINDDSALSSVEYFDPSSGQWGAVADMSTTRSAHGVVSVECSDK